MINSIVAWLLRHTVARVLVANADALTNPRRTLPYNHLDGYLNRWWLFRTPILSIRLHQFIRGDEGRNLHDHPWWNASIILKGGYVEISDDMFGPNGFQGPGSVVVRDATDLHRIVRPEPDTWTIFIHGWWQRDWGFHTDGGWVYWRDYLKGGAP